MDGGSEKDRDRDRSSRKSRDDRERERDHHHRDHQKHRHHRHHYEDDDDRRRRSRADTPHNRERSLDRGRDSSSSRKRKDHDYDYGDNDADKKRSRALEGRKERTRFEENGEHKEEKKEKRVKESNKIEEKEMIFKDDKVKEEDSEAKGKLVNGDKNNGPLDTNGSKESAVAQELLPDASEVSLTSVASSHSLPTKVSSITTTNENEGVSIIRSDEVHGKSSTDGSTTSGAGKGGSLSLDALAKAKRALQMQKELSAKLKKIPMLNKISSTSSSQVGSNKGPSISSATSITTGQMTSSSASLLVGSLPSMGSTGGLPGLTSAPAIEAVKRAQELAAKMGYRQDPEFAPLINMFPGASAVTEIAVPQRPSKAPVLRLDAQGREVDEHGNVINMPKLTNLSTLKVNINKQKKEAFQIHRPELDADLESNPHFDERMGINKTKLLRPKRMSFQFVDEGKWSKQAEIIKIKNQFGEAQLKELKVKQSQLAKAKAEPDDNPNLIAIGERVFKEKRKDEIPEIEWWDKLLLRSDAYGDDAEAQLNFEKITIYVEHPRPIEPPAEPAPPPPQPLKLTKREQKKLRTQRRLAKERDRQEMIRQGLLEPPKPKIKMSNLMKVLGSEATQDPTRMEMEIRSAAAEREQAHVDRNIARKLTPAERREKKERKLFEDPNTLETLVSVYKINDLSHPQTRFKVDVNAQENRLTGCAVISDGISIVVVEGGKKSIKRYRKLMLKRINWAAAVSNDDDDGDETADSPVNKCVLVWQGSVAKASFHRFLIHQCRSEAAARKTFADAGVPHYWDLAINFSDDLM